MKPEAVTARKVHRLFQEWLGEASSSEEALVERVESGLPLRTLKVFMQRGLSKDEVFHVVIPQRTLKHRRIGKQSLSRSESERAVRTARVMARAEAVFGSREAALRWMRASKRRFGGKPPIQLLATEPGGRLVDEMLLQIDEGIFA